MAEKQSNLSPEARQFLSRLRDLQDNKLIPEKIIQQGGMGGYLALHPELLADPLPPQLVRKQKPEGIDP